jgi:hypothetical protein
MTKGFSHELSTDHDDADEGNLCPSSRSFLDKSGKARRG